MYSNSQKDTFKTTRPIVFFFLSDSEKSIQRHEKVENEITKASAAYSQS